MEVLAIGAHPDDIELGCGGALLGHVARGDDVTLLVMTTGEGGPQDGRSRAQEQEDAADLLGARLLWGGFADGDIPAGQRSVDVVQRAIREIQPDVLYTHAPQDTHQDHRNTSEATLGAARRSCRILMYESPTTIGFSPSVFVDVAGLVEGKLDLVRAHMSQVLRNGLVDLEALEALARARGFQARVKQAEAFTTERFLWDLTASTRAAPQSAARWVERDDAMPVVNG
jgi:LmbE family N-acetylglucosaminyl deacetylase